VFDTLYEHLICEEGNPTNVLLKGTAKCSAQYIILLYLNNCHLKRKIFKEKFFKTGREKCQLDDTRASEGSNCTVVTSVSVCKSSEEVWNKGLEKGTAFSQEG